MSFSWKHPGIAHDLTILGAALDYVEIATFYQPLIPDIGAGIDLVVAGGGSVFGGETYYAQPDPSLPKMTVIGQDILVGGFDTLVGTGGKWLLIASAGTTGATTGNVPVAMGMAISGYAIDLGTSVTQAVHDTARAFGAPPMVSVGFYVENREPRVAIMLYCPIE